MSYHDHDAHSKNPKDHDSHQPHMGHVRESVDSLRSDQDILREEDEREELLTGRSPRPNTSMGRPGEEAEEDQDHTGTVRRKDARGSRREVLHKMEEGGSRSPTPSSDSMSDYEYQEKRPSYAPPSRGKRIFRLTVINVLIGGLFVLIAYGALKATESTARPPKAWKTEDLLSNGSSLFAPTTILISLDGFRADYLQRGLSPELASFIKTGVSPRFMMPSFPSVTFPNHYTLVTGMYPESHGIVGNSFYAPEFDDEFQYTDKAISMQRKWWAQAEPIWETAEEQGVPAAIHMWPGSEAHIGRLEPTDVDQFNGSETLSRKTQRVLEFLDRPGPLDPLADAAFPRPQLIAAYVPNVDAVGHKFGPNSTDVDEAISAVDAMLASLFRGLEARNLTSVVNIIVVSDHGMASTDASRVLQLEDLLDTSLVAHFDGWPHYGIRAHNATDLPTLYQQLVKASENHDHAFDFYHRADIPARYHFQGNPRIAPLWLFPRTGYAIATKADFDVAAYRAALTAGTPAPVYHPKGIHGYDNAHPLMRAIFVARGPAFPHQPGSEIPVFTNVEVYNILCDSLRVQPRPNNGTLRLPLQPTGTHFEHDGFDHRTGAHADEDSANDEGLFGIQTAPAAAPASTAAVAGLEGALPEETAAAEEPTADEEQEEEEEAEAAAEDLWAWIQAQTQGLVEWLKQVGGDAKAKIVGHHGDGEGGA